MDRYLAPKCMWPSLYEPKHLSGDEKRCSQTSAIGARRKTEAGDKTLEKGPPQKKAAEMAE